MKVLVTGGYGFIGSHVVERFNKEGYEVFIIDNLSSGKESNVNCKHKKYRLSVEDLKCEEIFRTNHFDTVVHLAAQANAMPSNENPRLDSKSNVLGLVNMLTLAQKYGTNKFIFASSAAVYGLNQRLPLSESEVPAPVTSYGISKWVGESYCMKWQELYGLETICFRLSNVYGPRQNHTGEGGIVLHMMNRIQSRQELVCDDIRQTHDFIYVKDVADVIFKSSYSHISGVYNLSANTEITIHQLISTVKQLFGLDEVIVKENENQSKDFHRTALDNTRAMRDLDWAPLYSIEAGLQQTYGWFCGKRTRRKTVAALDRKPSALRKILQILLPYTENALVFAITAWLTLGWQDISGTIIDIKLLYIILMAILYGNRQSVIAVALSASLFIYQKMHDGRELISLLYDTDFFFRMAVYLFIGLLVGYTIERKSGLIQSQEREIKVLSEKYDFLSGIYREIRDVKEELQQQILASGDSFGKIYSVTKDLESLEPEHIYTAAVGVVESIMKTRTVAIYTVNADNRYMRLVAHSTNESARLKKSIQVENCDYIQQMFQDGKPFMNKQLRDRNTLIVRTCKP